MIVLFFLFATARAVSIDSSAKWNIVDGVIPQGLDVEKGCHSGLRLSETKPLASIPISCANIRYSVYDSSVATMGYDEVTIDRSYTERNVVSEDGVCKMQMSSMDSTTAADVYTKGQDMKFFSRYGYCDGTYTGTKHFTETTFVSDRSCQERSEADHPFAIYTEEECAFYTGKATGETCDDGFVNHRCSGHGVCDNEDCTEFTCSAPYTGDLCNVIGDMAQPYGCWSDGTFNEFNREEHLDASSLNTEKDSAKDIRKQELLVEWGNLSTRLNAYSIGETVVDFVPETIDVHSIEFSNYEFYPYNNYIYQQTRVRARLQNIVEQINSAWAKFKYLRDLNAQLDILDQKLLNMKADMIAYNEVVEKLKLYGVSKYTTYNLFFGLGNSTRQEMQDKVASLNFDSEVSALEGLLDVTQLYTDYMHAYNNIKNLGGEYVSAWCQNSQNHRLYTTIMRDAQVNMNCFPSDIDGLYCDTNSYEFVGWNISAPCGGGTVNYGFPEYGNDHWDESALVKLGLNTKFVVVGPTSFKYLGTREPMESEKINSDGNYQNRYEGIHHMLDFLSIYEALQNITPDWKNLHEMGDYAISYEAPDSELSDVDREKRAEARELSLSNIRARETAIARGLLNDNSTGLDIDPLYESLVKLNHRCENCMCYDMPYSMNNDKPVDIRADCKEQCVGHDGFLLQWDTSQPRDVSHRNRHRSSCICAGDGEPVSELECVLSNREWISNRFVDQYELTPKDPTVKTGVQTKDVYLHCPGPMCSDGPSVGCWHWDFEDCNIGRYCSEASATVTAGFYHWSGNQHTWSGVHPYRLNKDTLVFGKTKQLDEKYMDGGYGVGIRAYYDYRYVGIATDLYGNVKETRTKSETEVISMYGIDYVDYSIDMWNSMEIFDDVSISNFDTELISSERGMWCSGKFVDSQCLANQCNFGFVEEICTCEYTTCVPGQYCTKDGVCKDVVKKEKKFLQFRYNSLE